MKRSEGSRRGVIDFILQRLTAVILGIYLIHLVVVVSLNGGLTFESLTRYFSSLYVLILTSLVIVATVIHAWIGMWTVGTDYLTPRTAAGGSQTGRRIYDVIVGVALVGYLCWSLYMIWTL